MGTNAFRYYYYPGGRPAPYWRRRFLALLIGLTALALITWAFSGALGSGPAGGQAAGGTGPGSPGTGGVPGAASGAAGPGGTGAGGTASPTASSRATARPLVQPGYCSKHAIVLSLAATQASFAPRQEPAFDVNVVSTQGPACSFNVGPKFLALVIRKGTVRIWSSADCVSGSGVLVSALRRGIPTVVPFSWNLQTSAPGCQQPVAHVPPGVYTAVAELGQIVSNPVTLRVS